MNQHRPELQGVGLGKGCIRYSKPERSISKWLSVRWRIRSRLRRRFVDETIEPEAPALSLNFTAGGGCGNRKQEG